MANIPSYKLVANNTPTASKAPFYGMIIPVGSIAYDDILGKMVDNGTHMTKATAEYLLDAFYEYCAEKISEDVVRISTGTVSVYPMISGSFDTEDAAFDPLKNTLYVGASFSQDVRSAVSTINPKWGGEESIASVKLDSEMDIASQTFKVIDGNKNFRLAGRNLTVPDGEDESIGLYSKDGLVKISDITVSANDGGQQLTCKIKGDADVPKGSYKIIVKEHGLDPTAPLAILSLNVTNLTDYSAPLAFISATSEGEETGTVKANSVVTIKCSGGRLPATSEGIVARTSESADMVSLTDVAVSLDKRTITGKVGAFPASFTAGPGCVMFINGETMSEITSCAVTLAV